MPAPNLAPGCRPEDFPPYPPATYAELVHWIEHYRCLACGRSGQRFPEWLHRTSLRCTACVREDRPIMQGLVPDLLEEQLRVERRREVYAEAAARNDAWREQRVERDPPPAADMRFLSAREWSVIGVTPGMASAGGNIGTSLGIRRPRAVDNRAGQPAEGAAA